MTTINITAVKENALTITAQAESWEAAAREAARWLDDPFYSRPPIIHVYLSDGFTLEEFDGSESRIKEDLARIIEREDPRVEMEAARHARPTSYADLPDCGHDDEITVNSGRLRLCRKCHASMQEEFSSNDYHSLPVECANCAEMTDAPDERDYCPACVAADLERWPVEETSFELLPEGPLTLADGRVTRDASQLCEICEERPATAWAACIPDVLVCADCARDEPGLDDGIVIRCL